ncbi:recombinase family protein [Marivirga sp. S37H4]|uniref:Recombinase family protein n=1 Tax=Marivirga aurantiaca TaxID=2802615 RepID=A0A934WZG3_9BACT|nr:recombinase family protein [Marivirga aurantiaca]MBK6265687.1 recombinase family protein [Marivirga aurantiaca]
MKGVERFEMIKVFSEKVSNLIEYLKTTGVALYIHNIGATINTNNETGEIFTKLIVTIMADLARLENEQMSYRIKSGIRSRKAKGFTTGRKIGSKETYENFLAKHEDIIKFKRENLVFSPFMLIKFQPYGN